MNLLVFNCGSSSQNYKVYQCQAEAVLQVVCCGKAHRVGVVSQEPSFIEHQWAGESLRTITPIPDHSRAAELILDFLQQQGVTFDAIGHRFVHGGEFFQQSVPLTEENASRLQLCMPLAPIHNPNSMRVIEVCQRRFPNLLQYLTFDTAFHASLPEWAYRYALPLNICRHFGLRKYGFHGLSYQYVSAQAAAYLGSPLDTLDIVACHLGTGGSSVAAIHRAKSLDTSMGYSPLAGLVMSTRSGDLDGLLLVYLMRELGYEAPQLNGLLNKHSGLLGLSGISADLRDLQRAAVQENSLRAAFAVDVYADRLKKTIAAYITLLGGADLLLFTDDIGANNAALRKQVCSGLEWAGVLLDETKNTSVKPAQISEISAASSRLRLLAMPTDEEYIIATEGVRLLLEGKHVGA